MTLLGLLVAVIILCLICWAVNYLAAAFALPEQIKAVILVLVVVIAVLWLLGSLTGHVAPLRLY